MDMNQFMQHTLDMQARQTCALEAIAQHLANYSASTKTIGGVSVTTADTKGPAETTLEQREASREAANQTARESAAAATAKHKKEATEKAAADKVTKAKAEATAAQAAADAAAATADTAAQAAADAAAADAAALAAAMGDDEVKAVKVTIDDVRVALKVYAAAQGNPAAMKLLADAGAKAVSELDQSKYAEFVAACAV